MKTFVLLLALITCGPVLFGAEPPSNPATDPLTLESLAALVPADVSLKRGSKPDAVGLALANAALKPAVGKQITLEIVVEKLTHTGSSKMPIVIQSRPAQVTIAKTKISCVSFIYVVAAELPTLGNVKKGAALTVTGRIVKADINNQPSLIIDLFDSTVKPRTATP